MKTSNEFFVSGEVIHADINIEPVLNASGETITDELRTYSHNGLNESSHIVGGLIFFFSPLLIYIYFFKLYNAGVEQNNNVTHNSGVDISVSEFLKRTISCTRKRTEPDVTEQNIDAGSAGMNTSCCNKLFFVLLLLN